MSVKNDDKKAVLAINKIVIAFLVIFVVILVIWFWFKLDIPGKLNLLIPGFNNTQSGEDANSIENKIYLDDGSGRCKPIKGLFSLKDGKLEVFSGNDWQNIDEKVATEQQIINKAVKEGLTNEIKKLKLDYNGKEYPITLASDGLGSKIGDVDYVFVPPNNLYRRNGFELSELYINGQPKTELIRIAHDEILPLFQNSFNNARVNVIEFSLNLLSDVAVNKYEQSTTSGQPDKITKKIFLYIDLGRSHFENSLGIDSSGKLYSLDSNSASINLIKNQPNLINDWKDIDGEVAKESNVQFKLLKDELVDKCKK